MDNDQLYDVMRDTIAFVVARYRDDEVGGYAIMANTDPVAFMIAQADYSIALIKTVCKVTGVTMDGFMETLTKQAALQFGELNGK